MRADIAIITIREDEYGAVFNRLKIHQLKQFKGPSGRRYATFSVPVVDNKTCAVALARSFEQGNDASQQIASDMIQDLNPQLLLVVGIAGGVPRNDFTLGDVIISSRIHNFDVNAVSQGNFTFDVRGGIHPLISDIIANLPMDEIFMAGWNEPDSISVTRPSVDLSQAEANVYGDTEWRNAVLQSLNTQFGTSASQSRLPLSKIGTIASSNSLILDTEIPTMWLKSARSILAVEMESAGVLQAAQRINSQCPVMAIRGISDIIGFKRDDLWKAYACQSAGAFTYAFIKVGIIEPQNSKPVPDPTPIPPKPDPIPPAPRNSNDPLDLFISYAVDDEKFKNELSNHLAVLRRNGTIRTSYSGQAAASTDLEADAKAHIDQSQIILLLISPSFLASDFLYDQVMKRAMERHASNQARVVPIIVRPAGMEDTPFSKLQTLPRPPLVSVDKAGNRDEVWTKIVQEIRDICKSLQNSQQKS